MCQYNQDCICTNIEAWHVHIYVYMCTYILIEQICILCICTNIQDHTTCIHMCICVYIHMYIVYLHEYKRPCDMMHMCVHVYVHTYYVRIYIAYMHEYRRQYDIHTYVYICMYALSCACVYSMVYLHQCRRPYDMFTYVYICVHEYLWCPYVHWTLHVVPHHDWCELVCPHALEHTRAYIYIFTQVY